VALSAETALARDLVDVLGVLNGDLARPSSTYWLCASCSSTTSISVTSLRRLGHSPVFRQTTQRTISAKPCSMTMMPANGIIALK
jgi:hypothetical protein